jgi:mRNA-degrading endonuclease YafQ of YafQ-DinJ toxin-antitoxin module
MFKIIETKTYIKKVHKFFKKHPNILKKYEKTIYILEQNPYHPSLRLHKLQGNLGEYFSISIDMEYRIVLDLIITNEEIYLIDIGSHDEVY